MSLSISEQSGQVVSELRILFESCDQSWFTGTCRTKQEINEWIKDKTIETLTNEERFQQDNYDEPVK